MLKVVLVLLAILGGFGVAAQQEKYLTLKKYTQQEGLSSYNITKIVQDRLGYLWIGTQDGLNRFDGRDFLIFKDEPGTRYRLSGNNVSDIVEDTARHILWVSTSYGGVTGIDPGTCRVIKHIATDHNGHKLSDRWVRSLAVRGNILWIGSSQGLLAYDITGGNYLRLERDNPLLTRAGTENISKLFVDPSQNLWVCAPGSGILVFPKNSEKAGYTLSLEALDLAVKEKELTFWDITNAGPQTVIIATSLGARSLTLDGTGKPVVHRDRPVLYDKEIFSCAMDENQLLWFSDAQGLYQYDARQKKLLKSKDADFSLTNWQSSIYQIYPDGNHNIWLGCQEGLALYHNQVSPFTTYCKSSRSDSKIQHAYTVLPISDSILICGAQDGTYRINTNDRSVSRIDNGSSGFLAYQHSDKTVFISNTNGLLVLRDNRLVPAAAIYPALAPLKDDILNSALRYNDSLVLFGSYQKKMGVYLWNTRSQQLTNYNNRNSQLQLEDNFCNTIYRDKQQQVWILSQSKLLTFNPLTKNTRSLKIKNPLTGEPCPILFDMCQVGNHYFFAAYGIGVVETDNAFTSLRVISTTEHLTNNGVYKMMPWKDSLLFITTNNGLSVLDLHTSVLRNYYQSDGLHSSAFEELCGLKMGGRIYAGGVNGLTVIEPQWLSVNRLSPRLYLNNIKSEKGPGEMRFFDAGTKQLEVPNDILQTTLNFSCINYSNPDRTQFAYRMLGLQESWVELGHQNFIDLVSIKPGKYTLEIKAANEDGVWCDPLSITIAFLPKWYQTWWFTLLLVVAGLLVVYGLYRQRLARLQREHTIRTELALDLHDELGSTLNSAKVFANLALREKEKDARIIQVKETIQVGIQSLRDIIWVMKEKTGTVENLLTRLNMFAVPFCEANEIRFNQEVSKEVLSYTLGQHENQHVYLILKEAINNSFKYSGTAEITIRVYLSNQKPVFVIADKGNGFVRADASEGNGLKNMEARAKKARYAIAIAAVGGTTITLQKR